MKFVTNAPKGADLFDLIWDGQGAWVDYIDLETFNIQYGTDCVFGQLYGNYLTGVTAVFGKNQDRKTQQKLAAEYGFDSPDEWGDRSWDEFIEIWQSEWVQLITERQALTI